jgi:hypothetical protein
MPLLKRKLPTRRRPCSRGCSVLTHPQTACCLFWFHCALWKRRSKEEANGTSEEKRFLSRQDGVSYFPRNLALLFLLTTFPHCFPQLSVQYRGVYVLLRQLTSVCGSNAHFPLPPSTSLHRYPLTPLVPVRLCLSFCGRGHANHGTEEKRNVLETSHPFLLNFCRRLSKRCNLFVLP